MKKIISIFAATFLPGLAMAQGGGPTVEGMVDAAVRTAFYIAGGVVVILWIVTGILFLSAQGQPEKVNAGKKALFAAVAGTVIVIVAGGAVKLVGSAFGL